MAAAGHSDVARTRRRLCRRPLAASTVRLLAGLALARPARGGLALDGGGAAQGPVPKEAGHLRFFHWDQQPECHTWNQHGCKQKSEDFVQLLAMDESIDFLHLLNFDPEYRPRAPFASATHSCGGTTQLLAYNQANWEVVADQPGPHHAAGCFMAHGYPYVVQRFRRRMDKATFIVGGVQFLPPAASPQPLINDLLAILSAPGGRRVSLMGDFNSDSGVPSETIGESLGFLPPVLSTRLFPTCCLDDGFPERKTYDRIITNFGDRLRVESHVTRPYPDWAKQMQHGHIATSMHLPVVGKLYWDPSELPTPSWGLPLPATTTMPTTTTTTATAATTTRKPGHTDPESPLTVKLLIAVAVGCGIALLLLIGLGLLRRNAWLGDRRLLAGPRAGVADQELAIH